MNNSAPTLTALDLTTEQAITHLFGRSVLARLCGGLNFYSATAARERECRAFLAALRWPGGVTCPRCQSMTISKLVNRPQFACDACRYQFSVTASTALAYFRLPAWKLLLGVGLACTAPDASIARLRRLLSVSYRTAWAFHNRLRAVMEGNVQPGPYLFRDILLEVLRPGGRPHFKPEAKTACLQLSQRERLRLYGQPVPKGMVLGWSCQTFYCGNPEHFCLRPNKNAGDRDYRPIRRRLAKLEEGEWIDLFRLGLDPAGRLKFRVGLQSGNKIRFVMRTLPSGGLRLIRLPDWHPGEPWRLNQRELRAKYPALAPRRKS